MFPENNTSILILFHHWFQKYDSDLQSSNLTKNPTAKVIYKSFQKKNPNLPFQPSSFFLLDQKVRHSLILDILIPVLFKPSWIRRTLKVDESRSLALLQVRVVHHTMPRAVGPSVEYGHFVRVVVFHELFKRFVTFYICAEPRPSHR